MLLFDDGRIKWLKEEIGTFDGQSVLELGPLEGGHSYMLQKHGAASVVAIEANTRAFLKCLIVKEILGLERVRFLCGDFVEYLRQTEDVFDICVASGVLYHMKNPVELIELLSRKCKRHLLLWTHYYDPAIIKANPVLAQKFTDSIESTSAGFRHRLYRQEYQEALNWTGFCGGSAPASNWMSRDDIMQCLEFFGFCSFRLNFDEPLHPHGPAFALIAERR
jgi:SAM-dependent methyltransferase